MINLLPVERKKEFYKEYKLRLVVVFLIFLFSTVVIASVLLLPLYLSLNSTERSLEIQLSSEEGKGGKEYSEYREEIKTTNERLALLNQENTRSVYDLLNQVVQERGTTKIQTIAYEKSTDDLGRVFVTGIAENRNTLREFVDDLRRAGFSEVNLPISSLIKDVEIPFSVEITL